MTIEDEIKADWFRCSGPCKRDIMVRDNEYDSAKKAQKSGERIICRDCDPQRSWYD